MSVEDRIRQELGPNVGVANIQSRLELNDTELLTYVAKWGATDFQELVRETLQYVQHGQIDSVKFGLLIAERQLRRMLFLVKEMRERQHN